MSLPPLRPRLVSASPPSPAPPPAANTDLISHFIDLEAEARQCQSLDQLRLAIVNSSRKLAPYDQAFLAEPSASGRWQVTRASSVARIDRHAPMVRALDRWLQHPRQPLLAGTWTPRHANLAHDAAEWRLDDMPTEFPHAFLAPIKARDGSILAGIIALKADNWQPQHSTLLIPMAAAYSHAWEALAPARATLMQRLRRQLIASRLALAAALAAALVAFVPVPLSVLAPAEIVAAEPLLVTAPIDGVIGELPVAPGSWVEPGTVIIKFVDIKLRSDLEVARRNKLVAQARYLRAVQSAVANQKDAQEIAVLKAEFDVAAAELDYAHDLLTRSTIKAGHAGLLIYSAKSDWLGKPVSVGERLMEIGDPHKSQIRIDLPISDAIVLKPGSAVSLFLDGDPLRAIAAAVSRVSYRPVPAAEQALAFRVQAAFADGEARSIGLRGVSRISGDQVPMWFYLFRRPLAAVRQWVGL